MPTDTPTTTTEYQYRQAFVLPVLGFLLLVAGCLASAVLAYLWPLNRVGGEMFLDYVVTDSNAPGAVFNIPLVFLGATPSIIGGCVLIAAGAIVDEMRYIRSGQTSNQAG